MKNIKWEALHRIYKKVEELSEGFLEISEDNEEEIQQKMLEVRSKVREELDLLRARLLEELKEREVYLVLFPIVAHFDELIQNRYLKRLHTKWPMLQMELFDVDNAGEMFFDLLDDILNKPITEPFIYEVFYFCLSYGFLGKYADNPIKIKEYLKALKEKIIEEGILDFPFKIEEAKASLKTLASPIRYYLWSVGLGVLFFSILFFMTRYWW